MPDRIFNIKSPTHSFVNTPMTVTIKDLSKPENGAWAFEDVDTGEIIALQNESGWWSQTAWFRFILPKIDTGQVRRFILKDVPAPKQRACVSEGEGVIDIQLDGSTVTKYNFGDKWVRPFLWPVYGPDNVEMTRAYPMEEREGDDRDHEHHKSIYHAHGDINGTDLWTEWKSHGRVDVDEFVEKAGGSVFSRISTKQNWKANSGETLVRVYTDVTVYALPDSERVFDFTICFRSPGGAVKFGDTKEGGLLSVRVACSMNGSKGGMIENAYGGRTEAECWGKPAPWVDYSGPVGGKIYGLSIFDHPDNMLYPTRWHVRDYGLFTANPFALHDYLGDDTVDGSRTLQEGEVWKFQYRVYIHRGDASEGDVRNRFLAWAYPPIVAEEVDEEVKE